ncbi:hypothetical protein AV530_009867 [Patagioenas fasciata monilis]|uniref:Uncharacterized protein n=1 Tax=Patagioenas fasciata monilis TaxID=372326 RepID=A0A1V4KAB2_PATFA|nr:hypothetical protein AV530_009867 [Patagioenas fasciata monilis]
MRCHSEAEDIMETSKPLPHLRSAASFSEAGFCIAKTPPTVTSASPGRTASPPAAFRSPPQDAKSVPGDFGPLSLYLTPGACGDRDSFASGGLKGPDLPPAVLRAKSFHLLLGQTSLEMTVWPKKGLQCVALREILKIAVPQLN